MPVVSNSPENLGNTVQGLSGFFLEIRVLQQLPYHQRGNKKGKNNITKFSALQL